VLSETEGVFDEVRFALFSEEDLAVYETALTELIEA
jgi:hypothetical protein